MIRNSGEEPHVVEYLKTPPSRAELVDLLTRSGLTPRDLLRRKGTPYDALGLRIGKRCRRQCGWEPTALSSSAVAKTLPASSRELAARYQTLFATDVMRRFAFRSIPLLDP